MQFVFVVPNVPAAAPQPVTKDPYLHIEVLQNMLEAHQEVWTTYSLSKFMDADINDIEDAVEALYERGLIHPTDEILIERHPDGSETDWPMFVLSQIIRHPSA